MMSLLFLLFFIAAITAINGAHKPALSLGIITLILCAYWLSYHASDSLTILL
ncbi:MAG: hypothetical protein HRU21_03685 [Pseudomonadales bacterium]|nr:hypothetical protein [Pseudomonadales bacterium]